MIHPRLRSLILSFILLVMIAPPGIARAESDDLLGWIVIDGPIADKPGSLDWLMGDEAPVTLRQLVAGMHDAASRPDIAALVIHIKDLQSSFAQIQALSSAIEDVQRAGKKVHVFAESYGPSELMLASHADEILMQRGGFVSFPGLYAEEMYLADTLALVGLKADMVQIGDYKGAADQMGLSTASDAWSQNIEALMDDLWAQMVGHIQSGRDLSDAEMKNVLLDGWSADSDDAVKLGLVDAAIDIAQLQDHIGSQHGTTRLTQDLGPGQSEFDFDPAKLNFLSMMRMFTESPAHDPTRDTIAVVHIDGPIVDGESTSGGFFGGSGNVGSRTIRKTLHDLEKEDFVKGVILRIESPGGSAIASEVIWQGVRRLAKDKPVFVSVGSMAASGGYYIAVSGDRIYVQDASIVGSIGVVGGKIVLGGLFDKINLNTVSRSRGPRAALQSTTRPWTSEQRTLIRGEMKRIYDLFTQRVTQGRGARVDLSRIAEGRLFTGRQAIENGMADGIADFDATIDQLASTLNLRDGSYDVMTFPGPKSLPEFFEDMMPGLRSPVGSRIAPLGADMIGALVGDRAWSQIREALNAWIQLRDERILLLSPRVLLFQ